MTVAVVKISKLPVPVWIRFDMDQFALPSYMARERIEICTPENTRRSPNVGFMLSNIKPTLGERLVFFVWVGGWVGEWGWGWADGDTLRNAHTCVIIPVSGEVGLSSSPMTTHFTQQPYKPH